MAPLEQKMRSSPRRQNTTKVTSIGSRTTTMTRNSCKTPNKEISRKTSEKSLDRDVIQKDNALNTVKKRKGPRPAHSGVPVPDKMRKLLDKLKKKGGLEHQPNTPLKSSMILKTLTPQPKEKVTILGEKMCPNRNITQKSTTTVKRAEKLTYSSVPISDKMKRLIDKQRLE